MVAALGVAKDMTIDISTTSICIPSDNISSVYVSSGEVVILTLTPIFLFFFHETLHVYLIAWLKDCPGSTWPDQK